MLHYRRFYILPRISKEKIFTRYARYFTLQIGNICQSMDAALQEMSISR